MHRRQETSIAAAVAPLPRLAKRVDRIARRHGRKSAEALKYLVGRRTFRAPSKLPQQVFRQRHTRLRGPRLEDSVHLVRYIADLNGLRHALTMKAHAAHVKLLLLE